MDGILVAHECLGRREAVGSVWLAHASITTTTTKDDITSIIHASCGVDTAIVMHTRRERRCWIYGTCAWGWNEDAKRATARTWRCDLLINNRTLLVDISDISFTQCSSLLLSNSRASRRSGCCGDVIGFHDTPPQLPRRKHLSYSCFKTTLLIPNNTTSKLSSHQDVALQQARNHRCRPQGQAGPHPRCMSRSATASARQPGTLKPARLVCCCKRQDHIHSLTLPQHRISTSPSTPPKM